jgi:hypothetical protein
VTRERRNGLAGLAIYAIWLIVAFAVASALGLLWGI